MKRDVIDRAAIGVLAREGQVLADLGDDHLHEERINRVAIPRGPLGGGTGVRARHADRRESDRFFAIFCDRARERHVELRQRRGRLDADEGRSRGEDERGLVAPRVTVADRLVSWLGKLATSGPRSPQTSWTACSIARACAGSR